MSDQKQQIDVLMYHSISEAAGPTSIPPAIFEGQMNALAAAGYHVADFADMIAWRAGDQPLPEKTAIITFDDGFSDFQSAAWPILRRLNFPAIVFLPTACLGGNETWHGANNPARPLMSWDEVSALSKDGATFGSHSLTHANLTQLDPQTLDAQLQQSRDRLEDKLGMDVKTFAAPYGAVNDAVLKAIASHYDIAAGTGLGRAGKDVDLFDVPRLEMHYYRDLSVWQRHLEGRGGSYLTMRKFARRVRQAIR